MLVLQMLPLGRNTVTSMHAHLINLSFQQAGIEAWTKALEGTKSTADTDDTMDTDTPTVPAHKLGGDPQIKKSYHDIRITNQV